MIAGHSCRFVFVCLFVCLFFFLTKENENFKRYVKDKRELKQETFSSHGHPQERKLFSCLTCPHTTTFVLLSIFSLVETIS